MANAQAVEMLTSRWRPSLQTTDLDSTFRYVVGVIQAPSNHREVLSQQGRLSPTGIAEQIRRHATKNYAAQLAKARRLVEDARAQLQMRRQSLAMPPIDRNDMLAAHLRSEARQYLRSLPISERQAELSKGDPVYVAAIAEAPLGMSGVDPVTRDRAIDLYLRQNHQAELEQLAEREEAVDALHVATEMAIGELRSHARLPEQATPTSGTVTFDMWFHAASNGIDPALTPDGKVAA